ncbi:nascent polypeptide-associated complex protein [Candidatus Woesearchaeota archaeon]|nr:nascent polypeptide-associated complex protein [Candidatus Woesearchaeota archaeon]
MIPGMNPRMMRQAMKRMGVQQTEIEATEVIIKTPEKDLIIQNPQVSKVNMMGQETIQVIGDIIEKEKETAPEISEDDIKTVAEQTGATEEQAKEAIEETKGDLAEAILKLKQ